MYSEKLLPTKIIAFAAFLRRQALSKRHFGFGGSLSSCTAVCQCVYTRSCISQPKSGSQLEKLWPGNLFGKSEFNYSFLKSSVLGNIQIDLKICFPMI